MFKIAICDDSEEDLDYEKNAIEKAFVKLDQPCDIHLFSRAEELLSDHVRASYDAVFIDIDMPGTDGMEAVERLKSIDNAVEIIFVTNHDELVYKAYRYKAMGFIRKKYLECELDQVVDTLALYEQRKKQYIVFRDSGSCKKINVGDIIYFVSNDHYVDVVTPNEKCVIRESLNNLEKEYGHYGFIRIHSRYMVNVQYIYSIEKNTVVLTDKTELPLSQRRSGLAKEKLLYFSRR